MSDHLELDDTDREILRLLTEDARRTVREIADAVHLSPAPVRRRIDRMERGGLILGYTTILDESRVAPSIDAFVELRFQGDTDVADMVRGATDLPEVLDAYTTAGDPDMLVRVRVADVGALRRVVNRLRRSGRVTSSKTLIVLSRWTRAHAHTARARGTAGGARGDGSGDE
ncbi:MAG: Lrp/AsnC family transcriptional regulator [Solirubrobacteraceae bacterium]|nr:Lrp/AsnC family transcriptional regulator [Solirubrobacteraceae bacterium]